MRISNLIRKLQHIQESNGNLDVYGFNENSELVNPEIELIYNDINNEADIGESYPTNAKIFYLIKFNE